MCADSNYNKIDNIPNNNSGNSYYSKEWHEHKHIQRRSAASTSGQKSGPKWSSNTFLFTSIILLLCQTCHVLAIRKGRLMSPSSFTALSGDLHVQIQFNEEDVAEVGGMGDTISGVSSTTPRLTSAQSFTTKQAEKQDNSNSGGNTMSSSLVISKFIEDIGLPQSTATNDTSGAEEVPIDSRGPTLQRKRKEILQNIPLFPDPRFNVTQVAVPCQTFVSGGLYEMQVVTNLKTTAVVTPQNTYSNATKQREQQQHIAPTMVTTTLMPVSDERLRQTLDVRWPSADIRVSPVRLRTYPESPVEVVLRFPEVNCDRAWRSEDMPEFWLELVYCGKESTCAQLLPQNISRSNILYAEQVHGYPKEKIVMLKCELFGLAGNYAVQLRPMRPAPNVPITRRFLTVDWSDKFVFNVYARSIFPCDPHTGIGVLYEYPSCILEQGDRVRVYAKLRADVASLKPPTSMHYVAEQRVVKSQYSLYFRCDLFTEKYVEYCFVYVSQAISGAVADVRMDCVPTLPVSDSDTGGWGPWSEWTPCSTNCLGGTRNRYRFCDSPPPRYGAKFCEGPSVETEKCGETISNTWDCIYETSGSALSKANRTEVNQEIGPGCRCGCIVHLGSSKPKRILAGATQSCPGRSFWLIQVDGEEYIALSLNFLRLPCSSQYIKVRDGPSLSSTLLIELNGGSNLNLPVQMESSGAQLLLEFYAGEEAAFVPRNGSANAADKDDSNAACTGGFLANAEQKVGNDSNTTRTVLAASTRLSERSRATVKKSKIRYQFTLVHLSAVVFASIVIMISALLGVQYVVRYRKYHLAVARRRDEGSRLHTPHSSMHSLQSPPSRALSTTTLLSEVIYLVKIRPKHLLRHSILRESVDAENLVRETDLSGVEGPALMAKRFDNEEQGSTGSIVTLRNEVLSTDVNTLSRCPSIDELAESNVADQSSASGTLKRKDSAKDSESIISSGMSSIYNSPPMNSKRLSKYSDRYDAATLKIRSSRLEDSINDSDSLRSSSTRGDYERLCQLSARSVCGSVSLTNGCYSPAISVVSTATIRTTNPKECKEKQNRRKLLARPGSEFSLGNQEELELDYYDYNVINAGAAPGSYLGMDPAYLVWIPPFDGYERDDDKTPEPAHEPDESEPLYEEIRIPKHVHYLSARSNTESSTNTTSSTTPSSDAVSPLGSHKSKATTPCETNLRNCLAQQATSTSSMTAKQATQFLSRKKRRQGEQQSKSTLCLGSAKETLPLHELSSTRSVRDIALRPEMLVTTTMPLTSSEAMIGSYVEKETTVVKSPSDLQNFLALDDIQFADESESDLDVVTTRKVSRQERDATTKAFFRDEKSLKDMRQRSSTGSGIRLKLPV